MRVQTILRLLSTVTGPHVENNFKILLQGMQISFIRDKLPGELSSHEGSGVHGGRSGESTRFPPMWFRIDSQIRRHVWVEFVGSLLCTERFSAGTPVSPFLKNQHLT